MIDPAIYEALGLGDICKKQEPEEVFVDYLTLGSAPRIDHILHMLGHDLDKFMFMKDNEVSISVKKPLTIKLAEGVSELRSEPVLLKIEDYAGLMLTYYLDMMHLTRFTGSTSDGPKLDKGKTVALLLNTENVKKIITKAKNSC